MSLVQLESGFHNSDIRHAVVVCVTTVDCEPQMHISTDRRRLKLSRACRQPMTNIYIYIYTCSVMCNNHWTMYTHNVTVQSL